MLDPSHQDSARKKIKFILNLFNNKFFFNKSVLDVGSGAGNIGASLFQMGASVTALDIDDSCLKHINKNYPQIKTIKQDLDRNYKINKRYDIVTHIGTLNCLQFWREHLINICQMTKDILILECPVFDSDDENLEIKFKEENPSIIGSYNKIESRATSAAIEKVFKENGFSFYRFDSEELNYKNNIYNWKVKNTGEKDSSLRRFWVCSKRAFIIDNFNKKYFKPINETQEYFEQQIEVDNKLEEKLIDVESNKIKSNKLDNTQSNKIESSKIDVKSKKIINNYILDFKPNNIEKNISIIIPTCKNTRFIDECIWSIKNQKFDDKIEILLGVDNCQETLTHIENNYQLFKDIKVFWFEKNVGPYIIKNSLVDSASYENILFFDSDDIMMENFIKETVDGLQNKSLVRYKFYNFYDGKDTTNNKNLKNINIYAAGIMGIRKNTFLKYNGFENWICAADAEFLQRMDFYQEKTHFINKPMFYRRLHGNNLEFSSQTDAKSEIRKKYHKIIVEKKSSNKWTVEKRHTNTYKLKKFELKQNAKEKMNEDCGIMLIAFGLDYEDIAMRCAESIRKFCDLPILIHTNLPKFLINKNWIKISNIEFVHHNMNDSDNRIIKTQLLKYSKFKKTLYADVDSEFLSSSFLKEFELLNNYDILCPAWKIFTYKQLEEKSKTSNKFKYFLKVADSVEIKKNIVNNKITFVGGGVCFFKRSEVTEKFFSLFHDKWNEYGKLEDMPPLNYSVMTNKNNVKIIDNKLYNSSSSTCIRSLHSSFEKKDYLANFTRRRYDETSNSWAYVNQGSDLLYHKYKICFIYDVAGWAFYNISQNLKKFLYKKFETDIISLDQCKNYNFDSCNAIIIFTPTFEDFIPRKFWNKTIYGISSHKSEKNINKISNLDFGFTNDQQLFNKLKSKNKYYLPNGVDNVFFKKNKIKNNIKNIGAVGSLSWAEHKGKSRVNEICKILGLNNKSIYVDPNKALTQEEMLNYYNDIDIFIVSSISETGPNPMLEALACGVPVLSNSVGLSPKIIKNNFNGYLIDSYNDIDQYVKNIKYIQSNFDKIYQTMSDNAVASIKEFSWEKIAPLYEKLIMDFIGKNV